LNYKYLHILLADSRTKIGILTEDTMSPALYNIKQQTPKPPYYEFGLSAVNISDLLRGPLSTTKFSFKFFPTTACITFVCPLAGPLDFPGQNK
jgi:hypothetical protein